MKIQIAAIAAPLLACTVSARANSIPSSCSTEHARAVEAVFLPQLLGLTTGDARIARIVYQPNSLSESDVSKNHINCMLMVYFTNGDLRVGWFILQRMQDGSIEGAFTRNPTQVGGFP